MRNNGITGAVKFNFFLPLFLAFILSSCKNPFLSNTVNNITISDLHIVDGMNEWEEESDSYKEFDKNSLADFIDEEDAFISISNGFQRGIIYSLKKQNSSPEKKATIFASDFGKSTSSKKNYLACTKNKINNDTITIGNYPTGKVIASYENMNQSCNIFANFDKFNIEIHLNDYRPNELSEATTEAKKMIEKFEKKIAGN